jgi:uncharacterized protein (TIGR02246 family)
MQHTRITWGICWACLVCSWHVSRGQEPEDPAHAQLRELRGGLVKAVNAGDLEGLISFLHPNVVVTWLDGTQSRGHQAVRDYYKSKTEGKEAIVQSYSVDPEVKELSFLYDGDAAIAYGQAVSRFVLRDHGQLDIHGPWTATMVKEGDRWLIAAFHSSTGMFDNPLLAVVKRFAYTGIAIAAVVALLVGLVVGLVVGKRSGKPSGP